MRMLDIILFFFFNDTATTEIYTLSLHDALPIFAGQKLERLAAVGRFHDLVPLRGSEEHTSELQSRFDIVCRLLLEKQNNIHRFLVYLQDNDQVGNRATEDRIS